MINGFDAEWFQASFWTKPSFERFGKRALRNGEYVHLGWVKVWKEMWNFNCKSARRCQEKRNLSCLNLRTKVVKDEERMRRFWGWKQNT